MKFTELKLNDRSNEVLEAATLLKKAGSTIKPKNLFTIGMMTAVKSFQKRHKLAVTGRIDLKTWNKLQTYKLVKGRKPKK